MKRSLFILLFILLSASCMASHITGGEMYYTYMGPSPSNPGKLSYKITLVLYKDTTVTGAMVANLGYTSYFSIFTGDTYTHVQDQTAVLTKYEYMNLTTYNPCLTNKPAVKYAVATYEATFDLDPRASGYYAANSQCCRISGVVNMNSTQVGSSYWVKIPGSNENIYAPLNSNAVFNKRDTILVCKSSPLNLDFSATDPDGDQLKYSFTTGYTGAASGPTQAQITPVTANTPTYAGVTYLDSYTSTFPLGANVTINPNTGNVTGLSPEVTGVYLITVLVEEYRNGNKISEHRKEFQVKVDDCSLTGALLKPTYVTCNGTTLSFENESGSSNITSYAWDFGIPGITTDTSSSPTPTYDYAQNGKDSGSYNVKLKVTSTNGCQDSTIAQVKVYPGFTPGFKVTGSCYLNKYIFTDTTKSKYGTVKSWSWNFGDTTTLADTSHTKDSAWKYPGATNAKVQLIVSNSYSCVDTVTTIVPITDRPSLNLPFRDTLICSIDTLALKANTSSGTLLWTPSNGPNKTRILNPNSNSPLVYPQDTTRYYVTVNDNGCSNTDSVNVNVLPYITVDAGIDTGICKTDTFHLNPTSYALSYKWTASTGEIVRAEKYPLVKPLANTKYIVIANLGKCQAKDSVAVTVVPYPQLNAGPDQTICYGSRVMLVGSVISGNSFSWSPTQTLINANTLTPTAGPMQTTAYIFSVKDTLGCPKPAIDTIVVTVIPQVIASAGRDTFTLVNQPLQLVASGGTGYVWTPSMGLNDPNIANPIATLDGKTDSVTYTVKVSDGACYATAKVKVKVYKTGADILVPSAFTPNGDGKNDGVKPILIGISKFNYFAVYNRWGQMLFRTTEVNKSWDGVFNGLPQPSGAYVYQTSGTDVSGNIIYRKGTIVLIR